MDIQSLISEAKESLLTGGNILPTLYLELTGKEIIMFGLDVISDTQSIPVQCGILARLGWETCKKHPDQQPPAISSYAEAWRVDGPEDDAARLPPVNSKKRQEIIAIHTWEKGGKVQAYSLPIIRDYKQRVTDVGPAEGPISNVSWQVASFLQGCRDAQKPVDEVLGKMSNDIHHLVAGLSPARRQELDAFMREEGLNPRDFFKDGTD